MSESLLIAIIGLAGAVLAGLIGAFGAMAAVETKGKAGEGVTGGCGIIGLAASAMAAIGLVVGLMFATSIVRTLGLTTPPPTTIAQPPPTRAVIVVTATPLTIRPTTIVQNTEPSAIATTVPILTQPPPTARLSTPVPQPSPTLTPIPPPTATVVSGKYPCPLVIKQSEVESWKVGQTTVPMVQDAVRRFDSNRPDDASAFVKGTKIPSGVLVATNFDERDGSAWTRYPVIPIVNSGSWGLFQTTGEYTAPNVGACMTIIQ